MKITKQYLRTVIKEELERLDEGFFGNLFGKKQDPKANVKKVVEVANKAINVARDMTNQTRFSGKISQNSIQFLIDQEATIGNLSKSFFGKTDSGTETAIRNIRELLNQAVVSARVINTTKDYKATNNSMQKLGQIPEQISLNIKNIRA